MSYNLYTIMQPGAIISRCSHKWRPNQRQYESDTSTNYTPVACRAVSSAAVRITHHLGPYRRLCLVAHLTSKHQGLPSYYRM